jgi:chitin synthase
MSNRDQQRPPRSARPNQPPAYPEQPPSYPVRPPPQPVDTSGRPIVSFRQVEQGDRQLPVEPNHTRTLGSGSQRQPGDPEHGEFADSTRVGRKKSLVRPDREKIEPGHPQWHYRSHVAEGSGRVGFLPSSASQLFQFACASCSCSFDLPATGNYPQRETLRRGRSLLAREEDVHESRLALFKKGATLRRKRPQSTLALAPPTNPDTRSRACLKDIPGPKNAWMIYCYIITICVPPFLLRSCGGYPLLRLLFGAFF